MKVRVELAAGVEYVDVDLENGLTAKQMVRFQKAVGNDVYDDMAAGRMRPDALVGLVWSQVSSLYPEVTIDDIDFDLEEAAAEVTSSEDDDPGKL